MSYGKWISADQPGRDAMTPVELQTALNDITITLGELQDECRERVMDTASQCIDIETLKKGILAVRELIDGSDGVYGLHLNGDGAPWDELQQDGMYRDWLSDFNNAEDACDQLEQSPLDKS